MAKQDALKAEAQDADVTFEYDGEPYTIKPMNKMPLEFLEAIEDGKMIRAVKSMLGEEQYRKFSAKPRIVEDLNNLLTASTNAVGVSVGESNA